MNREPGRISGIASLSAAKNGVVNRALFGGKRAVGRVGARHVGAVAVNFRAEVGQEQAVSCDWIVVGLAVQRGRVLAASRRGSQRRISSGVHDTLLKLRP
jgi:hypothetical protein